MTTTQTTDTLRQAISTPSQQTINTLVDTAFSIAGTLANLNAYPDRFHNLREWHHRGIVECADRIISLRTMHAIGDLTIPAADRGAIAGTLRSQQVTP